MKLKFNKKIMVFYKLFDVNFMIYCKLTGNKIEYHYDNSLESFKPLLNLFEYRIQQSEDEQNKEK